MMITSTRVTTTRAESLNNPHLPPTSPRSISHRSPLPFSVSTNNKLSIQIKAGFDQVPMSQPVSLQPSASPSGSSYPQLDPQQSSSSASASASSASYHQPLENPRSLPSTQIDHQSLIQPHLQPSQSSSASTQSQSQQASTETETQTETDRCISLSTLDSSDHYYPPQQSLESLNQFMLTTSSTDHSTTNHDDSPQPLLPSSEPIKQQQPSSEHTPLDSHLSDLITELPSFGIVSFLEYGSSFLLETDPQTLSAPSYPSIPEAVDIKLLQPVIRSSNLERSSIVSKKLHPPLSTSPYVMSVPNNPTHSSKPESSKKSIAPPSAVSARTATPASLFVGGLQRTSNTLIPSSSNRSSTVSQPRPSTMKVCVQKWKERLADVRYALDQIPTAPAKAAKQLLQALSVFRQSHLLNNDDDYLTIPLDGRLEILLAFRFCASQVFYKRWVNKKEGLYMIQNWFHQSSTHFTQVKASGETPANVNSAVNGSSSQLEEDILSHILQVLNKLPLTVPLLKEFSFGRVVRRINTDINGTKFSDKIKELSSALENKWRELARSSASQAAKLPLPQPTLSTMPSTMDSYFKSPALLQNRPNPIHQRPLASNAQKRPGPPFTDNNEIKKRKIHVPAKPPSQNLTASLFGRTEKTKLPSFKILPKPVNQPMSVGPPPASAGPVFHDPFAEAMGLLKSRAAHVGEEIDDHPILDLSMSRKNSGSKPSKTVRFRSDPELCQVKIVERLVYECEGTETPVWSEDARGIDDADEGRYLHYAPSLIEEEMEWQMPIEVVLTAETITNLETSPLVSAEATIQEEREKLVAEVDYGKGSEVMIPETPGEPSEGADESIQPNGLPKILKLSGQLMLDQDVQQMIAQAQADNADGAPVANDQAISDLLARLDHHHQAGDHPLGASDPNCSGVRSTSVLVNADLNRVVSLMPMPDHPLALGSSHPPAEPAAGFSAASFKNPVSVVEPPTTTTTTSSATSFPWTSLSTEAVNRSLQPFHDPAAPVDDHHLPSEPGTLNHLNGQKKKTSESESESQEETTSQSDALSTR